LKNFKINIFSFLAIICTLIIISNLSYYFDLFQILLLIFTSFNEFEVNKGDLLSNSALDLFFSLILILPATILLFIRSKKNSSSSTLRWEYILLSVFLIILFFAPLLVRTDPNFQKDIGVRKLKEPLSTSNYLQLMVQNQKNKSHSFIESFSRKVYDGNIHYFTDFRVDGDSVIIIKNNSQLKLPLNSFTRDGEGLAIKSNFHLFGTDHLGRDIYSQLIYAIRISMFVAIFSTIIASFIGISLGIFAGYFGGIVDTIISRISDIFLSIPPIFLILLIIALFGSNVLTVVLVLGVAGWISLFRIVKSEYLIIAEKDYIISSKLLGLSKRKILFKEIFPLMLSPIIVNLVFLCANVILAEAVLSFFGLGIGLDHVSLGKMLQTGQEYIAYAWWLIIMPGMILVMLILTFNKFADTIKTNLNPLLKHD
jgi:peptide/nickel transport system permease protein